MSKSLIVLAQSLEQPRVIKRIIQQSRDYTKIDVYGFVRDIQSVKNYSLLLDKEEVDLHIVGKLSNSRYLKRLMTYAKLWWRLLKDFGFKKADMYIFGLDLRTVGFALPTKNITYEISDIIWLYMSGIPKWIFSNLDRFLAWKSRKVVFTSEEFYNRHYKNVPEERIAIFENKLETYGRVEPIDELKSDKIRIAYIGAFRYDSIIKNLIEVVASDPCLILNFYGDGNSGLIDFIKSQCDLYDNIDFHGAFKNPDDLQSIYAANNLNFVVYQNTQENEQLAMPNKFYESGFFNIPIICATNTYVGRRVLENGMGWIVDVDRTAIESFFNDISISDLQKCHERIKDLPKSLFSTSSKTIEPAY